MPGTYIATSKSKNPSTEKATIMPRESGSGSGSADLVWGIGIVAGVESADLFVAERCRRQLPAVAFILR